MVVDVPFHKPNWVVAPVLGGIGLAQGRAEEIRVASRRLQSLLLTFGEAE